MKFFPSFRSSHLFSSEDNRKIIEAIRAAEQQTSGEIRIYIESRCKFVDPLDRASEVFWGLKMDHTAYHNAVLLYVAVRDHQFAIYADKGIHEKLGNGFWKKEVEEMSVHFREHHYLDAILYVIKDIGEALHQHFPYDPNTDRNELPDEIIFGK